MEIPPVLQRARAVAPLDEEQGRSGQNRIPRHHHTPGKHLRANIPTPILLYQRPRQRRPRQTRKTQDTKTHPHPHPRLLQIRRQITQRRREQPLDPRYKKPVNKGERDQSSARRYRRLTIEHQTGHESKRDDNI